MVKVKGCSLSYFFAGSNPATATNFFTMERRVNKRNCTIASLFTRLGRNDKVHASLKVFSVQAVRTECTRQNKYDGADNMNPKYVTSTRERDGYVTIMRRY